MKHKLKKLQTFLTKRKLDQLWINLSHTNPQCCVQSGINLSFCDHKVQVDHASQVFAKLKTCPDKFVATPVYEYCFEPENEQPHHVSALTIFKNSTHMQVNFFNPKGVSSHRKKMERVFLKKLGQKLYAKFKIPVKVHMYKSKNLQYQDSIGICQLLTFIYLWTFLQAPGFQKPHQQVQMMRQQYDNLTHQGLLKFWSEICHYLSACSL